MVTVYTLTFNEELLIQFMIDHYRSRFPGCRIVVYNNIMTDDNTEKIARANGCEIRINPVRRIHDDHLTQIKNTCWQDATTDWVLVCDLDELLDINEAELKEEEKIGTSIIRSEGYNMVDMEDKLDIPSMKYGAWEKGLDKFLLFNKKFIQKINYTPGAHAAYPTGRVVYSQKVYKLYHYCYINYDETVKKYRLNRSKISPEEIKNGNTFYEETPEQIRALYTEARSQAIKVR